MNRRLLLNVILLVVVLALGLLAWKQPGIAPVAKAQAITPLHAQDITRLSIETPGADAPATVRLEKREGVWMMDAPLRTWANGFRIESLLPVVETSSRASFAAAGHDLDAYGLAQPRAVLEADGTRIAFGGSESLDHRRYLRVGDTIHLTDDLYLFRLQGDFANFVSASPLPPDSRPRLIDTPGLALARDEEGKWTATGQGEQGPGPDTINATVDEWRRAQALSVEAGTADGDEAGAVRVQLDSGAEIDFRVLRRGTDLLLARDDLGVSYVLTDEQAQRLLPGMVEAAAPEGSVRNPDADRQR